MRDNSDSRLIVNREVVGFFDPDLPATEQLPHYPLRTLWQAGVPLTLCTDNPGISQTTLSREYLTAARMVGGLSLWEVLALIKQSYRYAFLPAEAKNRLMKQIDLALYKGLAQKTTPLHSTDPRSDALNLSSASESDLSQGCQTRRIESSRLFSP